MKYHDMPIPEDISKLNVNVLNVFFKLIINFIKG